VSYYAKIGSKEIEAGLKQQKGRCAAAYALARQYPELRRIQVDQEQVRFTDDYDRVRHCYRTPKNLVEFIDKWDAGKPVEPIQMNFTRQNEVWKRPKKARSARDLVKVKEVSATVPDKPRRVPPSKSISIRPLVGEKQDPSPMAVEASGPAFSNR
jgi:hypothetical protein